MRRCLSLVKRYSVEPRIFIKDYLFLYFAKNIGKNISKNLSGKYSAMRPTKVLDSAKKSRETKVATDTFKNDSKREIQK